MPVPRTTFNVIELTLLGILVAIVAFFAGRIQTPSGANRLVSGGGDELRELEAGYGPSRNSEHGEEWVIRDYFKDQRDGVFVDVGANHYQRFSNTYYLEHALGWSGLAIEPQQKFAADYATYRPRTKFIPLFVADVSNREATLYVPPNDLVASADERFARTLGGSVTATTVMTTTLDDILDRSGIDRIDFMSMDIELGEPAALAGFSIERFRPRLVCVEAHPPIRQQLLDYFARHRYVPVGRYWAADNQNFWFAPLGEADAGKPSDATP